MIYKGKGKRTRFRRCRRSSWLHRAVLWWWIYIKKKEIVGEFNQITWRDEIYLFIFFIYEINLEFIFIIKFIKCPIKNINPSL